MYCYFSMSYEIFRKLYICAVMLQKGTLVSSMKKKKNLAWCDLFHIWRLPFHKEYATEKQPCIDFILDLFLIVCICHFF